MAEHILKVVPPYFEALWDGTKTFEVRANDRAFQRGDQLVLWEYDADPRKLMPCRSYPCKDCNPRAVAATVGFVYAGDPRAGMRDALTPGHVVLSLLDIRSVDRG